MAEEVIVKFVLGKLLNVIEKEAQFLLGVKKKAQRVERELTSIKCYLKDADAKRRKKEGLKNWLDELRNAAYRIEDATDTFFLQIEGNHQNGPNFLQKLKKSTNKLLEVYLLHQLGTELDDIQDLLKEIFQRRINYGIEKLEDETKEEAAVEMSHRHKIDYDINENDVIGLQADKNNILKLLPSKKTPWQAIITITGPGGVGKTTLAQMVYKSAMEDFEYHIMLPISKQFNKKELLIKMLRQKTDSNLREKDIGELINKLRCYLSTRRYLILLDDVWGVDLWNQLQDALPKVNNGSCILVTSRFTNVVQSSDFKMELYELGILDHEQSRDLLLKKALHYGEKCSNDLLKLADKLSKKCDGLPLALIVLGGVLLGKSSFVWESILQKMDWYSDDKKGCMDVLAMSYHDMPHCLKPCFLYLSSFPEDYVISAKFLIKLWVAEGFILCEGRSTMEETAQKYLEQISERSMIQVSSRSINGLIQHFKLHDLIRELAMHEAEQQNIVTVFLEKSVVNKPKSGIRRAAVQSNNTQSVKYVGPNTRSFLCFSGLLEKSLPKCSNFKLLKVLVLVGVTFSPDDLKGLIHLKFLVIRACFASSRSYLFRHMRILETLVMQDFIPEVHWLKDLWTISTLKHVRYTYGSSGFRYGFKYTYPVLNSTAYLTNLQTLKWVDLSSTLGGNLSHLNHLHKLGVRLYKLPCGEIMTNLLKKLPSLISLGMAGFNLQEHIIYPRALPHYQNLQSLHLIGNLSVRALEASFFPPNLIKLKLRKSLLEKNPMPELGKLRNLKKLILGNCVLSLHSNGDFFCPTGFPVLQYLQVGDVLEEDDDNDDGNYTFERLIVEKGAMPNLTNLKIKKDQEYRLPTELQHVTINYY